MPKRRRGFAAMDKDTQLEIARKGGKAAHASGNAHEFTPEEAKAAGRRGGRVVSKDRAHMAEIGRRGGEAAHARGTAHEWNESEAAEAGRRGGRQARATTSRTQTATAAGRSRTARQSRRAR
jgi:general stress protein YciG